MRGNKDSIGGKIDKAGVINIISSISSDQILFITFKIWFGGGKTYVYILLLGQEKNLLSKPKAQNIYLHMCISRQAYRISGNLFITQAKAWWLKLKSLL